MRAHGTLLSCALFVAGTVCGGPSERPAAEATDATVERVAASQRDPGELEVELITRPFRVDRIFQSMRGPVATLKVHFWDAAKPELLWLTGYAMEVVAPDGSTPASMEFECHTNLNWTFVPAWSQRSKPRIFTLTQGQTDIRMPSGFGLPVLSNEELVFSSQVLNLNEPGIDVEVAHRARLRYVRDRDLSEPMKPLIATNAQAMVSLEDESLVWNVETPDEHLEGASCQPGEFAGGGSTLQDGLGRKFTPHWVVPPGRHEYRTLVTDKMAIPYDTTVHFIGVHVHPHSESLELRDLTTGETVFKSHQQTPEDRLGLVRLEYYSSEEGIPVHADHQYELISIYDNPTDHDRDAMAVMFIYYLDKAFEHPLKQHASARRY